MSESGTLLKDLITEVRILNDDTKALITLVAENSDKNDSDNPLDFLDSKHLEITEINNGIKDRLISIDLFLADLPEVVNQYSIIKNFYINTFAQGTPQSNNEFDNYTDEELEELLAKNVIENNNYVDKDTFSEEEIANMYGGK